MARVDLERDPTSLKEFLRRSVLLVGGDVDGGGGIDMNDRDPVYVAVVVDVTSYGRHQGAIFAVQNRFRGHLDAALEGGAVILEEWLREHYGIETNENFEARAWKLSADEFAMAIRGTDATKYIEIYQWE